MEDRKLFTVWEEQLNCLVKDAPPDVLTQELTKSEFEAIAFKAGTIPHGVHHADRKKFLAENGYEPTRENMVDPNLSHAQNDQAQ